MTNNQAVYDLNDYLLSATEVGTLLDYAPGGISRIVPTQQQPEMNDTNNTPYITYTWRTVTDIDLWWMHTDEISYVIWGPTLDAIAPVANAIMDNCRALDQSASDMMNYLLGRGEIEYKFHWIRLIGSYSPDSSGQEAGRLGWVITLRAAYVPLNGKHLQ